MKSNCIYFVEGKCEATLLAALKERPQKILSGRVKIFNVITNLIPPFTACNDSGRNDRRICV